MSESLLAYAVSSQVFVVSLPSGALLHVLTGHAGNVTAIAVSRDVILTGSSQGEAFLWNASSGKLALQLSGSNTSITAVALEFPETTIAFGWAAIASEDTLLAYRMPYPLPPQRVAYKGS
jgi:F-box and WD-40 domain protein CDC4